MAISLRELETYSLKELFEVLPDGFSMEKSRIDERDWYKIKYPKISCSMCSAGHEIELVLAKMILALDRSSYIKKYIGGKK